MSAEAAQDEPLPTETVLAIGSYLLVTFGESVSAFGSLTYHEVAEAEISEFSIEPFTATDRKDSLTGDPS